MAQITGKPFHQLREGIISWKKINLSFLIEPLPEILPSDYKEPLEEIFPSYLKTHENQKIEEKEKNAKHIYMR